MITNLGNYNAISKETNDITEIAGISTEEFITTKMRYMEEGNGHALVGATQEKYSVANHPVYGSSTSDTTYAYPVFLSQVSKDDDGLINNIPMSIIVDDGMLSSGGYGDSVNSTKWKTAFLIDQEF